ncbi:MAG TPA: SBBP repeat-containing protein, partial [Bacteroidales bacterium]
LIMLFFNSICAVKAQVDFVWGKQFGTDKDDKTRNVVVDSSGNIYVLGKTMGEIGKEHFGKSDAFIVKIDSAAKIIWTLQIGSKEDDDLLNAAVDNLGNIYATGTIGMGKKNTPNKDVLVVKINSSGQIVWQKQFGTDSIDEGNKIAVDANGDIYIAGSTRGIMGSAPKGQNDCFILHLDNNGNQLNAVQFGTSANDEAHGITIGSDSKIYVCGLTEGDMANKNIGKTDIFWGIFSKELKQLEIKQFGTSEDEYVKEIKTDNKNNIYIAGNTNGSTVSQQKGNGDAFLQKWNEKGEIIWTKQFGTNNWDGMHSIAIVQGKGIVVSGCYDYPLCKSFINMYDEQGNLLWNRNIVAQGKGGGSCGKDVYIDRQGYIYHAGYTGANLFSELKGEHDLFLVKLKIDMKK